MVTLVVLDRVCLPAVCVLTPFHVFGQRVERMRVFSFGCFNKRHDELFEEIVAQQMRPVVMEEVDNQSLDERTVLIL